MVSKDEGLNKGYCRAYNTYQTQLSRGGDGRPDFLERKTCNWITETFQVVNIFQRNFVQYDAVADVPIMLPLILFLDVP